MRTRTRWLSDVEGMLAQSPGHSRQARIALAVEVARLSRDAARRLLTMSLSAGSSYRSMDGREVDRDEQSREFRDAAAANIKIALDNEALADALRDRGSPTGGRSVR